MRLTTRLRRSLLKRYDHVRAAFGLPEAPGWNRAREEGVRRWYADPVGHLELIYDHEIGPDDVVLDLGGYEGAWAAEIHRRYRPTIHIFEPVAAFSEQITQRFAHEPTIHSHAYGLAGADQQVTMRLDADASAVCDGDTRATPAELRDVGRFLEDHNLHEIALAKVNIEGGEYELLESLLDRGLVSRFRNLQVQFHTFVPDANERMAAIQRRLSATHEATYRFPYVWENWRRRDNAAAAA